MNLKERVTEIATEINKTYDETKLLLHNTIICFEKRSEEVEKMNPSFSKKMVEFVKEYIEKGGSPFDYPLMVGGLNLDEPHDHREYREWCDYFNDPIHRAFNRY